MAKALKITGIVLVSFAGLLLIAQSIFRNRDGEVSDAMLAKQRTEQLREAAPYSADTVSYRFVYRQDSVRGREIREYFRLDTLVPPSGTTWEKSLALARFVARNIPHANQKVYPEACNATGLWEYSRTVEPAFNCRLHAIMLHELLLASDIANRFVTCLPADSLDQDCHVVNIVWLPERRKWAMIDSDQTSFVTDPAGTPLSLAEMREKIIAGEPMEIHPLGENEVYDDLLSYWAKNLYWFVCWEETGYDREPSRTGRSIALVPPGFRGFQLGDMELRTSDPDRFWAAPYPTDI